MVRHLPVLIGTSLLVHAACSWVQRVPDTREPAPGGQVEAADPAAKPAGTQNRSTCDVGMYVDVAELPEGLRSPPTPLGTHELELGDELRFGELKLWSGEEDMELHCYHGDPCSEGVIRKQFMRGAILPDYERSYDGDNISGIWVSSDVRVIEKLRTFRWFIDRFDPKTQKVRLIVDRVVCEPRLYLPPLEPGQSKRVWLSTQGAHELYFTRMRPPHPDQLHVYISSFPYLERGDGVWGLALTAWSTEAGRFEAPTMLNPSSPLFTASIRNGSFTVHVERVETGAGTQWVGSEEQMLAPHRIPNVHVLVRIEREQ